MEPAKDSQQQVAQFDLDCVTGDGNCELQSRDFFSASPSQRIERRAFYASPQKQWNFGRCSYNNRSRITASAGAGARA
jgi:hypothetical protein